MRDTENKVIASGELSQLAHGSRVTTELVFHFKDGSVHQETRVFSQRRAFQLITYHLVQHGPTFKRPTDMTIHTSTGQVTVRYTDDGKEKAIDERTKFPPDLANGLVTTLLGDLDAREAKTTVSMLVSTPKPRLVKLEISPGRKDSFSIAGVSHKATEYIVKVEIGGVAGIVAPIVGKQPPDTHIWMTGGTAPGFVRSEGPLFEGGPIWRIDLARPVWPQSPGVTRP